MTLVNGRSPYDVLQEIARRAMITRGLVPEFSPEARRELERLSSPASVGGVRDLRALLWCSIDNDESRDLDQLTVAEPTADGKTKILVAIADVAALVAQDSAIDRHAAQNTTSVYTAAKIFPMLPERLSTDLTSLNYAQDRRAVVVEMVFDADGALVASNVYEAAVRNWAKLAYDSVAAWLEGEAPPPPALAAVPGLAENIRAQDAVATRLRASRFERGALSLETIQARPVFEGGKLRELAADRGNRAKALIADLMIAANGVTAEFLGARRFPSIRRIVRTPQQWDRIVAVALKHGGRLPAAPDGRALARFLEQARVQDPLRFPDLSLSIVKLMGAGEYVVEDPANQPVPGHFGLAVKDYAHSTAPNRRFPDLITQRLVKAALAGRQPAYTVEQLAELARHCTEQEDDAKKVERQVGKSAAAILLGDHVGEDFDGLVTGASPKGTWVRLLRPPVEGKLLTGAEQVQVGQRVRVRLVHVDIDRGFIDFLRVP